MAPDPTAPAPAAQTAAAAVTTHHEPFLTTLLSNPPHTWIVAGSTLLGLIVVAFALRHIVLRQFEKLAERTAVKWDDLVVSVLKRINLWLILPALVYGSIQSLTLPPMLERAVQFLAVLGLAIQFLLLASRVVDAGLHALAARARGENGEPDSTVASSLGVARVIVMGLVGVIVVLLALDNLGVKITPMLTGLGIGGIAVALAVQNILSDLFGSLTIILDKPFVIGDAITVGDKSGTVERIGIKTTRVRAQSGEQLVFANSDLLTSRVQNFKRMQERRIAFTIGVAYETPPEKVKAIPAIIRAAIERNEKVRMDRCHFKSLGSYSLDFESVYFVLSPDYQLYMNIQQAINLELLERFAAEGISFAYPTAVEIQRTEGFPPGGAHARR